MRKGVVEFLFNEKKYRLEKFLLLLLLYFATLYITTVFQVSLFVLFVLVFMLVLIMSLIKIMWYNKKEKKNTSVIDWIGTLLALIVLAASVFLYLQENKIENAVYEAIEDKVGDEDFTIDYFERIEKNENAYLVHYTIGGENTEYWGWYDWQDGELIHNFTRTIENN
ncbi:hypothetical protein N780_08780 [Pontibacillus chungwhensis BH030062]|uniref:Uncharacterized protein n=1 Tax=Pontibacillus chungwhensis BH030062 TaxID=1385513 RepID=A0A0A2UXX9_9BACI|nr:hypothetical protein [Pontibacillus chungwhensis]KGP91336.1 hypothetical protein N780_08780 [Pontibacillus chungwhensis BH030062]